MTLTVTGLTVRYGGVTALDDVSLTVEPGELVGLIGPNGAGKTTFLDAACGFTRCGGEVRLGGRPLDGLGPARRARAGLARTWQGAELFDDLTVRENLAVGAYEPGWRRTLADTLRGRSRVGDCVDAAAALLGIEHLHDRPVDKLPQGQRKLIDVCRALAAEPEVLLLDEPAAGLDTAESAELGDRLKSIVRAGTGVLLIDHDMGLVLAVCDRIVVLDFGVVLAQGTPDEIRRNEQVIAAYLGEGAKGEPR